MPIGMGIIGIVVSILFFFIALVLYDAIQQNVVTCSQFSKYYNASDPSTLYDANMTNACNAGITYANIAFIIAPIGILLDVFGILPIFGGRFSMRE
jgi:hypothetical protein